MDKLISCEVPAKAWGDLGEKETFKPTSVCGDFEANEIFDLHL